MTESEREREGKINTYCRNSLFVDFDRVVTSVRTMTTVSSMPVHVDTCPATWTSGIRQDDCRCWCYCLPMSTRIWRIFANCDCAIAILYAFWDRLCVFWIVYEPPSHLVWQHRFDSFFILLALMPDINAKTILNRNEIVSKWSPYI